MLSWLFSPQIHKSTNGYYINHDNLIPASNEERKKLIFYFIACQTPEKLDPIDFQHFREEQIEEVGIRSAMTSIIVGGYTATRLGSLGLLHFSLKKSPLLSFGIVAVSGFIAFSFSYQLGHTIFEPKFVANNKVLNQLAQKYNFSVFDFAQAKKESHYKNLVQELAGDSAGVSSF